MALSETKIRFATGAAALTSKLIDGTFPDYDRVIPSGNDKVLEVKCKEFAEAVDRISTISSQESRAVKLAIAPPGSAAGGGNGGTLTVSATSPENGTAVEEIDAVISPSRSKSALILDICWTLPRRSRAKGAVHDGELGLADDRARSRRSEHPLRPDADARLSFRRGGSGAGRVDRRGRRPHIISMDRAMLTPPLARP